MFRAYNKKTIESKLKQLKCLLFFRPRMAYCGDDYGDEHDEAEDESEDNGEDQLEDEEYRRAFERMKFVAGEDDNYARVMLVRGGNKFFTGNIRSFTAIRNLFISFSSVGY